MMKKVLSRILYLITTFICFRILVYVMDLFWNAYVPLTDRTNLLGFVFVMPVLVILSFVAASLIFKLIKKA